MKVKVEVGVILCRGSPLGAHNIQMVEDLLFLYFHVFVVKIYNIFAQIQKLLEKYITLMLKDMM